MEFTREQLRSVPLETMREWYADRAEQSSLRALSSSSGVPHSTLHSFVNGSVPHPRVRRVLAAHYLRELESGIGMGAEVASEDPANALAVLTRGIDGPERRAAHGVILRAVEEAYHTAHLPAPAWLSDAHP